MLLSKYPNNIDNESNTVHDFELKIRLEKDAIITQERARRIPIHLHETVDKAMEKLELKGYIERAFDNKKMNSYNPM